MRNGLRLKIFAVYVIAFSLLSLPIFAKASGGDSKLLGQETLVLSFEQRLLSSYILVAEGKSLEEKAQIFEKMQAQIAAAVQKGVNVVEVQSFTDFLKAFKGDWPETFSVEKDLAIIEGRETLGIRRFVAKSARVQKQIDQYIAKQNNFLKAQGQQLSVSKVPVVVSFESVASAADEFVKKTLGEFDKIGEKVANVGFANQHEPAAKLFMQTLLSEYFARMSSESKKQIVSAMMAAPLNLSDMAKFEIMVQNSGPQLQKLLQVVARQSNLDGEMLKVFKALESAVKPVPWVQVQELLAKENSNYKFVYFERKPLGVGTMAQVHRAKIDYKGQIEDVVVRFIKPNIEKRIQEDHRILMEVAGVLDNNPEFKKLGVPQLSPMIEDVTQTVRAELNQSETVDRQKQGAKAYESVKLLKTSEYITDIEIHVPRIFDAETGKTDFMVQEMVFGKKLDKESDYWKNLAPGLKKAVVEVVARVWMEEVMFKSGFYHSDMHQGNFMVQLKEPAIRLNILDFGMGGVISSQMQKDLVLLGAGMELNHGDLLAKAFWGLSDRARNGVTEDVFKTTIRSKAIELALNKTKWGVAQWSAFALDSGLRLPYEFVSLNRGQAIVDTLLADAGSKLTMQGLAKELAMKHPFRIYEILTKDGGLRTSELVRLGYGEVIERVVSRSNKSSDSTRLTPAAKLSPVPSAIRCESIF